MTLPPDGPHVVMAQPSGTGADGFGVLSVVTVVLLVVYVAVAIAIARRPLLFHGVAARVREADATHRLGAWVESRVRASRWGASHPLRIDGAALAALLAGLAVIGALGLGFAEILDNVLDGEGVVGIDVPASRWLAAHRDAWLTSTLRVITDLGSPVTLAVLALVICGVAALRSRSWLPMLLGVVGVGGIAIMVLTIKALVGRPRPLPPFAVIDVGGFSFPSGHATGAAAAAVLCAWMVAHWVIRSWRWRVAAWATAIAFVGAVGFSRVYLGVHYVSDVMAGWLLGSAWAVATIVVGSWWMAVRQATPDST